MLKIEQRTSDAICVMLTFGPMLWTEMNSALFW